MLPEDCISEIISWTSPLDAAKLCVTSKAFKAAADSDTVWKTFLPSDYQDIISRQLVISWGQTPWCWEWKPHINSRFSEVAQLSGVSCLDIRGKIDMNLLCSSTNYAAYFVFQLGEKSYGLGSIYAGIKMVNHETDEDVEKRVVEVNLHAMVDSQKQDGWGRNAPRRRADGWLEVDMGDFSMIKGIKVK
ncbi:hypothetical protein LIER_17575 [Lithospermum erythrorhizon]|uniref:F-box domain-containing protein n=1 Tax=Lithospermum erythrorhizon TaxID=34254 RepID=A0AAV3QEY7_LITER